MNEIILYLKKILKNYDKVIVACSAGPDSMCLLSILNILKKEFNLTLVCAHVNHQQRIESLEEAKYVQNYCKDNNIIYELLTIEKYTTDNFHNESRKLRYNYFEELVKKYHAQYLMTAHHADDLMETILMRLTRGSTLKGYAGFEQITIKNEYRLVRPLISVTKDEIIAYNEKNNIEYYIDKSNYSDKYTRNRYREILLPFLKKENPDVHKKYLKFHETLIQYNEYINKIIDSLIKPIYQNKTINLKEFNKMENFIQTRIIERIFNDIYQDDIFLINEIHLNSLIKLIKNPKSNVKINLPNNIIAQKNYNEICFIEEATELSSYNYLFDKELALPNDYKIFITKEDQDDSNFCLRINSKEITLPLSVRTRQNGDFIKVKNLNGHKKINDIFIDEKVSLEERNKWPIVTDSNNHIIWLPGLKKSKFAKNKSEKYDIILKYEKKKGKRK